MRKKLLDDVSVNELLEFRREGYTNSQIAEMLDVCSRTSNRQNATNRGKEQNRKWKIPIPLVWW